MFWTRRHAQTMPVEDAGNFVADLSVSHHSGLRILDGISATFARGELTAVIGHPLAGKSVLLRCLSGHEKSEAGHVVMDGREVFGPRADIALIDEAGPVDPSATVREHLASTPRALWERIVDIFGLAGRLDQRVRDLPSGNRFDLACARALMSDPEIAVVDQPRTESEVPLFGRLRRCATELGTTIIAAARDPKVADFADLALLVDLGRVVGRVRTPSARIVERLLERATHNYPPRPRLSPELV